MWYEFWWLIILTCPETCWLCPTLNLNLYKKITSQRATKINYDSTILLNMYLRLNFAVFLLFFYRNFFLLSSYTLPSIWFSLFFNKFTLMIIIFTFFFLIILFKIFSLCTKTFLHCYYNVKIEAATFIRKKFTNIFFWDGWSSIGK